MLRTHDFVNKVKNINVNTDSYLVSLDIESLFTNVPTLETIEIILELAFKDNAKVFHNLTREELKKLLVIVLKSRISSPTENTMTRLMA